MMRLPKEIVPGLGNIKRKFRIWFNPDAKSSMLVIWNNTEQQLNLHPGTHSYVIIESDPVADNQLTIKCTSGSFSLAHVEINYSWTINSFFNDNYPTIVKLLESTNFDLSVATEEFLTDLKTNKFFISSGENNFSATTNICSNVKINDKSVTDFRSYKLVRGDILSTKLIITTPADETNYTVDINQVDFPLTWVSDYNKEFISKLDHRFYQYVDKKLANDSVVWEEGLFSEYKMPYGHAIRIQSQLLNNIELIKNKKILDLGCNRGEYLYPCLELGCESIVGAQPMNDYNEIINQGLYHLKYQDKAKVVWGDVYDLEGIRELIKDKDTVLLLGLMYHINNHYQLLETITRSDVTGLVIDISIFLYQLENWNNKLPLMVWNSESQDSATTGWELNGVNSNKTLVGWPNAAWIINALEYLGWTIKSNVIHASLRLQEPQLRYRGVITAYRNI